MRFVACSRLRLTATFAALLSLLVLGSSVLGVTVLGVSTCTAQTAFPVFGAESAYSIPQSQLIQPAALNQLLHASAASRPLILQVGSHVLYVEARIPGSAYVGPGAEPDGLQALQNKVSALSRKKFIVLYCGCCPWGHCPNVGPAYQQLRSMGFTHVKVLYLPNNFGADWVSKGYPVE